LDGLLINFGVISDMAKRKYTKRSDYWKKFESEGATRPLNEVFNNAQENWEPDFAGDPYYTSESSKNYERRAVRGNDDQTGFRQNAAAVAPRPQRFANIEEGILPFNYTGNSGIDIRATIRLCQKAYANIAIFRNAVDIMAEFSNTDLYLTGGTEKSRVFLDKWFQKINLWDLKDQFFREYYRSGNIFMYRIDGKFNKSDFAKMSTIFGSDWIGPELPNPLKRRTHWQIDKGKIPLKYIMLNPYQIAVRRALSFNYVNYQKILSEYELESLRDPKTEEDEEIYKALSPEARHKIKNREWTQDGVLVNLDPNRLIYTFYKKQDYEPFAIPFGFPVLDDLNWKIELKKMDQAICRTVENVILLITMGAEPDKGGINPMNLNAMQSLFKNESIGRVLVSDYTTKAEFIIPELNKVLGPEKYDVVNQDIKEALQNVVVGQEKYNNTQVKAQIFLDRLQESRRAFLNNFLNPQIKLVCKAMGFRKYPVAEFETIDLKDEVQLNRVVVRLMELGILTPEQGVNTIKTGIYPNPDELTDGQDRYTKEREKGYYNPLVGGVPVMDMGDGPSDSEKDSAGGQITTPTPKEKTTPTPTRKGPKDTVQTVRPNSQRPPKKEVGRPAGTDTSSDKGAYGSIPEKLYSRKDIQKVVYATEELNEKAIAGIKKHYGIKRMSTQKKELAQELCRSVVTSAERALWEEELGACVKNMEHIESLSPLGEVNQIACEHDLDLYPAALLYHSKKNSQLEE
jgi:hypothetical protein